MRLLARRLRSHGIRPVQTREPGGTTLGDELRAVLLRSGDRVPEPLAELFLIAAMRAQHWAEVIGPALRRGRLILCDRFTDSTEAYQGHARGIPMSIVRKLNRLATSQRIPDLTILLDCPVPKGLDRANRRLARNGRMDDEGRFEQESLLFHEKVRRGYLNIARHNPRRVFLVDAERSARRVGDAIWPRVLSTLIDHGWKDEGIRDR